MPSRIAWDLRAQLHGDRHALARERLLYAWTEELDDDAERFLGTLLDALSVEELLIWLARRGSDGRERPNGVPSSMELAKRILAQWSPAQGFEITFSGQGFWHRHAALYCIDSDVWGEIAPEMIRGLGQTSTPSDDVETTRWMLAASMRGCPRYATLSDLRRLPALPDAARRVGMTNPWRDALLALVDVRRDPAACDRVLIECARRGAAQGDFEALGLLDVLGVLDRVDPLVVLPPRVALPFEPSSLQEERDDGPDGEPRLPCGEYPIALALRWPEGGRGAAEEWVRGVILDAVARGIDPRRLTACLFGRVFPHEASPAQQALAEWLRAPSAFDPLMRASIEREEPLPPAWVTVVRDLQAAADGAWMRALRWLARGLSEALADPDGRASRELIYEFAHEVDAPPALTPPVEGVGSPGRAMWWIALDAPLPSPCDEGIAALLELAIARLFDWRRAGPYRRVTLGLDPLAVARWMRVASLPEHPARRTRLLAALRANPYLLRSADVRAVLERFAPIDAAEAPPFACWLIDGDDLCEVLTWYDRHGGADARAAMTKSLDRMLHDLEAFEPGMLTLAAVCAKHQTEAWRRDALTALSSRHFGWLIANRDRIEAALDLPLDLVSIARDRLHGRDSFTALPDAAEFVPLLAERLRYLATSGVARCSGWDPCEALDLAKRLVTSATPKDELQGLLVALVSTEAEAHAVAALDMLADLGASRATLLEVALRRIVQRPSEPGSVVRPDAAMWLARRMTTRSAWERDGASVLAALVPADPDALARLAHHAVFFAKQGGGEEHLRGVCDAILTTFARRFAEDARASLDGHDHAKAKDYLLALMELDAPSFAMRFVRPLRKHPGACGEVATTLDACCQQLSHDTGRISSPDNVARALQTLLRRARARARATA